MAERLTPGGLIVGLLVEETTPEPNDEPKEPKPEQATPAKRGPKPKK